MLHWDSRIHHSSLALGLADTTELPLILNFYYCRDGCSRFLSIFDRIISCDFSFYFETYNFGRSSMRYKVIMSYRSSLPSALASIILARTCWFLGLAFTFGLPPDWAWAWHCGYWWLTRGEAILLPRFWLKLRGLAMGIKLGLFCLPWFPSFLPWKFPPLFLA